MAAIPDELSTEAGPPLAIPLRHFLAAIAFPLLGVPVAIIAGPGAILAHVHLLLAGWVCLTIMGAMTQFVPVWSGVRLRWPRLARLQLPVAAAGVLAIAAAFAVGRPTLVPVGGLALLAGLWLFVASIGRTLLTARPWDVTEAHFAVALACFAVVPLLGLALGLDYTWPILGTASVARSHVLAAHATLAVFGAILTTVLGALYQLGPMFTGTDLDRFDRGLQRGETAAYPAGVAALALGRLLGSVHLSRLGAALILVGLTAAAVVLARRLAASTVAWSPMHRRYAVAIAALVGWVAWTAPVWLADPLGPTLGPPAGVHLLALGAVGFVVLGTLYHVVPFLVWVHRYSDRLGLEPVPLVDDLYDHRVAAVDLLALLTGTGALVVDAALGLPPPVGVVGGLSVLVGFGLFAANVGLVVTRHAPGSIAALIAGHSLDGGEVVR